jgi:hypothetical protein
MFFKQVPFWGITKTSKNIVKILFLHKSPHFNLLFHIIIAISERVYVRLYIFEMPPLIENPADCEIRAVIRYLSAKGVNAIEIHRNICKVYGQNKMSF